jgi:hypothetical protein
MQVINVVDEINNKSKVCVVVNKYKLDRLQEWFSDEIFTYYSDPFELSQQIKKYEERLQDLGKREYELNELLIKEYALLDEAKAIKLLIERGLIEFKKTK